MIRIITDVVASSRLLQLLAHTVVVVVVVVVAIKLSKFQRPSWVESENLLIKQTSIQKQRLEYTYKSNFI